MQLQLLYGDKIMANILFPTSPSVTDEFTDTNGVIWVCTGVSPSKWARKGGSIPDDIIDVNHLKFPYVGRNIIVNGDMSVSQENGSTALTTSSTYLYAADQFTAYEQSGSGINLNVQRQDLSNGEFSFKTTATSGTRVDNKTIIACQTPLEGNQVLPILDVNSMLSFDFKSNVSGIHGITFQVAGASLSYCYEFTSAGSGSFEHFEIDIGTLLSSDFTQFTTSRSLVVSFSQLQGGSYVASGLGRQTGQGWLETPNQVDWTATANGYVEVKKIQLEAGTKATEFEQVDYGTNLAKCQRYYQILGSFSTHVSTIAGNPSLASGVRTEKVIVLPVFMRVAPSVTSDAINDYLCTATGSGITGYVDRVYMYADVNQIDGTGQRYGYWNLSNIKLNARQ
jgi:hypothetical protein